MAATNLLDFDLDGLAAYCEGLGEALSRDPALPVDPPARVSDFAAMSDLASRCAPSSPARRSWRRCVASEQASADGTIKWLFDVGGGNAVETVFIPEADRATLCVSSQAGCAVGCRFCATGHQGFSRNLSTGEIVAQLRHAEHAAARPHRGAERVISNVVMMGMGEPLQNYAALLPALRTMLDDHGCGLSRRRRDGLDVGRGADDRAPARGLPGRARRVAACAQRRAARRAGAAQPQSTRLPS